MKASPLARRIAGGVLAAALSCCAIWDQVLGRLSVFGVRFGMPAVDVSRLVYPGSFLDIGSPSSYGVDIRCRIKADNPGAHAAIFDGATGYLRAVKTGRSDPSVSSMIPAFSVGAGRDTSFDVVFPIRLSSPVFSKAVWKRIVKGDDIPYKVDADLRMRLANPTTYKILDSLGTRTLHMDVVSSSVSGRETRNAIVEGFLAVIERVL